MFVTAYNPTDGPVLIDPAGRILGGGEFGAVDTADEVVKAAFDAGRLVKPQGDPARSSNEAAAEAAKNATRLEARAKAFRAVDKPVLLDLAADLQVPGDGDDGTPHKDDLVTALVRSDIDIPAATPLAATPAPKEA